MFSLACVVILTPLDVAILLLPVLIFFCTPGVKTRDQSSSGRLRSSSMPRSKEVASFSASEKQKSSNISRVSEKKERSVESKKNGKKEKKVKSKEKEAKTQGDELKFNSMMLNEDASQSIHTDLGSLKEDDNPLLDKKVQERLNRTKSVDALAYGSLKFKASKANIKPSQSQMFVMPTQSEPTFKSSAIVSEIPKQEHSRPSLQTRNASMMMTAEQIDNETKKQSYLGKAKTVKSGSKLGVTLPSRYLPVVATQSNDKEEFFLDKGRLDLPTKENKVEQTLLKENNGSQHFPAPQ